MASRRWHRLVPKLATPSVAPIVPSTLLNGLVNYYPMQETSGTRVDIISGTNLTDNNTVGFGAGRVQVNSANFIAVNQEFFSQAGLSFGNNPYTWSFWTYANAGISNAGAIVKGFTDLSEYQFQYQGAPNIQMSFRARAQSEIATVSPALLDTQVWYHIVCWRDPGVHIGVTLNSGTAVTVATAGTITSSAQMMVSGSMFSSFFMQGRLEQMGRWNRILTALERAELFNQGIGLPYPFTPITPPTVLTGLAAYWTMDQLAIIPRFSSVGDFQLNVGAGITVVSGMLGRCSEFNGTSSSALNNNTTAASLTAPFNFQDTSFTIAGWISADSQVGTKMIFSKDNTIQRSWSIFYDTVLNFRIFPGPVTVSAAMPGDGTFHFFVAWHNPITDTINLQVDNGVTSSTSVAGGAASSTAGIVFGDNGTGLLPHDGKVDEVGCWTRLLTSTEKSYLYNGGIGRTYPFSVPFLFELLMEDNFNLLLEDNGLLLMEA